MIMAVMVIVILMVVLVLLVLGVVLVMLLTLLPVSKIYMTEIRVEQLKLGRDPYSDTQVVIPKV